MYNFKFLKINFSGTEDPSLCYDLFIPNRDGLDTTTFFGGTYTAESLIGVVRTIFKYHPDDYRELASQFQEVVNKAPIPKYEVTSETIDINIEKYPDILEKGCLHKCEPLGEIIYPADTRST
ncbi:MAG: hypothetical protein U9Q92_01425 [archaeon]|nr:hypothetical protein [archaeon]